MAGSPIARLFAQLGFKVDRTGLTAFENDLKSVRQRIDSRQGLVGATDKARASQSKLFSEIKGNYSKVRPSLKQMRLDLKRLDGAMFQNKISAEEYADARKRVTEQIGRIEKRKEADHQRAIKETMAAQKAQTAQRDAAAKKQTVQMKRVEKMFDKRNFQLKELRANTAFVQRQYRSGNITLEERRRILQGIYTEYRRIQSAQAATAGAGRTGQPPRRTGPFAGGADPRQAGSHGMISALHSDVGLGTLAAGFAAAQSVQSYQNFVAMEQGLTAATGSVEQAGKEMEYLMNLSDRMGVFVGDLGKSFTGLSAAARGTSLEGQGVRDVFQGVAAQARVLNLSAADTQGVFTAVTQIMNKGTVMSEELKNQLGERLPGSMQAAARAAFKLGVTQDDTTASLFKAMEQSKLASEEFLPVFAEELWEAANQGGALAKAMQSTGAAIGRFRTNLFKANKSFNEAGFDRNIRVLINLFSEFLYKSEGLFQFFGKLSEFVIYPLRALGEVLLAVGSSVDEFVKSAEGNMDALLAFTGVFFSLFKWGRKILAVFILLPGAISGVTKLVEEGQLSWSEWAVTLGGIAGTLLLIINRMKRAKDIGTIASALRGGATGVAAGTAAGTAAGGLAGGAAAGGKSLLARAIPVTVAGAVTIAGFSALAALIADFIKNPFGETGISFEDRKGENKLPGGGDTSTSDRLSRIPGDVKAGLNRVSEFVQSQAGEPIERDAMGRPLNVPRQPSTQLGSETLEAVGSSMNAYHKWLSREPSENNFTATFNITGDNATEISDEVIRVINEQLIRPASASDPVTER